MKRSSRVVVADRSPAPEPSSLHISAVVYDRMLIGLGYEQIALSVGSPSFLGRHVESTGSFVPEATYQFVLNVEAGSIRYRDDGGATDATTGELWPAGSSFTRAVDPRSVSVCAAQTGAIVNVSYYGLGGDA